MNYSKVVWEDQREVVAEFSVVIPAYNEARLLPQCIASVRAAGEAEIIVADGGSSDETAEIALGAGARLCRTERCRGLQCNAGAAMAHGGILLFLHADTALPPDAFAVVRGAFRSASVEIGTFRLAFDVKNPLLSAYAFFTRFDSLLTRFGDQCIAMRSEFFRALGGFPEWRLFEDVELLRRARKRTIIHSFPARVTTSARKFVRAGALRRQWHNGMLIVKYLNGVSPVQLAEEYENDK